MTLLLQGSMVFVFLWLVFGGLGIPVPEDIAVLSAGVLVHRGAVSWEVALGVVLAGVLVGDSMLFFLARRLGARAFERPLFRRLLPVERRARLNDLYARYGGRLVFLARHVAGLRGAVFAMAGINGMAPRRFLLWDALAACISVPLTMALGYFGSLHVDRVRAGVAHVEHWVVLIGGLAALGYVAWRNRHKLRGGLTRSRQRPMTSALGR
ncbi:MAG: yohD [Myxococcales bacterium]|nr:yohD [Myxococcales bacterium]